MSVPYFLPLLYWQISSAGSCSSLTSLLASKSHGMKARRAAAWSSIILVGMPKLCNANSAQHIIIYVYYIYIWIWMYCTGMRASVFAPVCLTSWLCLTSITSQTGFPLLPNELAMNPVIPMLHFYIHIFLTAHLKAATFHNSSLQMSQPFQWSITVPIEQLDLHLNISEKKLSRFIQ